MRAVEERKNYWQGYIAGADRRMEQTQKKAELESALLSPLDSTSVGITMSIESAPGKPRGTLRIRTILDPATISLAEKGNRWEGKIDEMFVEMKFGDRKPGIAHDALEAAVTLPRYRPRGRRSAWSISHHATNPSGS